MDKEKESIRSNMEEEKESTRLSMEDDSGSPQCDDSKTVDMQNTLREGEEQMEVQKIKEEMEEPSPSGREIYVMNEEETEFMAKKRRIGATCSLYENAEIIEKAMKKLAKDEDDCGIFGKYVAGVMRSLSSEHLKKRLKKRIQHILLKISDEEEGQFSEPTSLFSGYSPAM